MQSYRTVPKAATVEFTEKRSRFLGHIRPVISREEAGAFLSEVKKKYWDARHNVPAYILREGNLSRCSDDGEPAGAAGLPVLEVLTRAGLTDCAVVVTRYFGGILLGAGGLVRAYTQTAKLAVERVGIVTMHECARLEVRCDYGFYGKLSSMLKDWGMAHEAEFLERITARFSLPLERVPVFQAALRELSFGQVEAELKGTGFAPFKEAQ